MANKPNILMFLPDAMPASVVQPGSQCLTPNFDRVAARGLRFDRCYTTAPATALTDGFARYGFQPPRLLALPDAREAVDQ